ncbi:MAG TPA: hypothetical protein VJG32_16220 [Anaerolineae bacterium]|nr:hypothetical protein [Anaerolineae bacterium]
MTPLASRPLTRVANILLVIAILVFMLYFVIYLVYAFALFRFPYDYDQGEGFELNDSLLFARGEWPYQNNETFPFYASNYGPVFHLMVLPLFAIFGPTLAAGRALSFLATLVIGGGVYMVVQRHTRDRPIAVLSALLVFASNFVYHIGPLFRQHMTMVLFELLAVVMISQYDHPQHGRRNIVLSMVCLLLAGYTKQLSAATAVAVLAFLFLRAPKKAIGAGLGLALVAGAIFIGLNAATQGQWFVNSITANANVYDYGQALELYGKFFSLHFVIAILAIGYLAYELYWDRLSAYGVWFAFALVNAALAGKWGAGESYFTTAIVAACILSGLAIGKLRSSNDSIAPAAQRSGVGRFRATTISIAIPLLYLAQAWGMRHLPTDGPVFGVLAEAIGVGRGASVYAGYPYYDSIGYTQVGHLPTEEDARSGDRIVNEYVRPDTRPALSEEALFALRAGKPVVTNPTQLLNLWNNDALDPTELITLIDAQAFNVVVLRAQFYPDPVLRAIGARYEPIDDIWMNGFQYRVLGPRADYGLGCDEARLYAMKRDLEQATPQGTLRIASRDTRPEGWSGAAGVTEFEYRLEDQAPYRLWIAPRAWSGQPPENGGATYLGSNACFKFFDRATTESTLRAAVQRVFEVR